MSQVTYSDTIDLTKETTETLLDWYYTQRYIVHRKLDDRYLSIIKKDCEDIKKEIIKRTHRE